MEQGIRNLPIMNRSIVWRIVDSLWLIGLAIYILIGIDDVPFHGDESTIIAMSRDYHYLVQEGDLDRVLYRANSAHPDEQWLRIINGTVSKMAIGAAWDIAGFTVDDLNTQWLWGGGWEWNVAAGHVPGDRLLRVARWSSALMLVISAWAIYGIAWLVAANPADRSSGWRDTLGMNLTPDQSLLSPWADRGNAAQQRTMQRAAAMITSAIYITTPAVLMNGRRAMFEGAHLCFVLLAVLAAIRLARVQQNPAHTKRDLIVWAVLVGVLGGGAIASKHTAVIAVGALFFALFTEPLIRPTPPRSLPLTVIERVRTYGVGRLTRFTVMSLLVIGVFLLLNPAWWSDIAGMPNRVIQWRNDLLRGQSQNYLAHDGWGDRVVALVENTFWAKPQYHESELWRDYDVINEQIAAYDGSWLAGRGGGAIWGAALVIAFALGVGVLVLRWREGAHWVVLVWLVITTVMVFATTTLNWQRYYIPLHPIMAVIAGLGAAWAVDMARRARR
jgi:hypothetical protein